MIKVTCQDTILLQSREKRHGRERWKPSRERDRAFSLVRKLRTTRQTGIEVVHQILTNPEVFFNFYYGGKKW